jgi:hypothetical protein
MQNVLHAAGMQQFCYIEPMSDFKKGLFQRILRALIETGFIIFLFYSNLLMGEYDRSGNGQHKSLMWVLNDIFTKANFEIALGAAIIGYLIFEFLRKKV